MRHGVAMALREVIKLHGNTAAISVYTPPNKVCFIKNRGLNLVWFDF